MTPILQPQPSLAAGGWPTKTPDKPTKPWPFLQPNQLPWCWPSSKLRIPRQSQSSRQRPDHLVAWYVAFHWQVEVVAVGGKPLAVRLSPSSSSPTVLSSALWSIARLSFPSDCFHQEASSSWMPHIRLASSKGHLVERWRSCEPWSPEVEGGCAEETGPHFLHSWRSTSWKLHLPSRWIVCNYFSGIKGRHKQRPHIFLYFHTHIPLTPAAHPVALLPVAEIS